MVGKWMRKVLLPLLCVGLAAALTPPGSAAEPSREPAPSARGCYRGPESPGWFWESSAPNGYVMAVGSRPCVYVAEESGGIAGAAGDFAVRVERDGQVRAFSQQQGQCLDGVIQPGDRVTVRGQVAVEVGADSGCAHP